MPIVSGGLFKSEKAKNIVDNLVKLTNDQLAHSQTTQESDNYKIVAGCLGMESVAEKVNILNDNKSLILGRLFSKKSENFEPKNLDIKKVKETNGTWLGQNYWGRYLLLSVNQSNNSITIFRDPQGLLTLFYMPIEDGILFSTEISLIYDALNIKPELNWEYLVSYVVNGHNITNFTPFKNIIEIDHGCATTLDVNGNVKVATFWDPTELKFEPVKDEAQFQEQLYQTFKKCTQDWAQGADKICTELSGGLDSSSVLAVLKDVVSEDKKLTAVNMYHPEVGSSIETDYAQKVADSCNVPLQFLDWSKKLPFASITLNRRFNKPSTMTMDSIESEFLELAQLGINDEVMCGQGGDHLFLAPPPIESVADYFIDKGFKKIGNKIGEISAHHRTPFMKVFSKSAKAYFKYLSGNVKHQELTLAKAPWMKEKFNNLINEKIFIPHFWDKLKKISPAKVQHIIAIYQATLYVDRGYKIAGKAVLNPLLSQPLVELALSMPTYQTSSNGYNRYQFRSAMAKHKTGDYIWRKSKGETSGVMVLAARKHADNIASLVLEGRFAKEGLVDRAKMEEGLIAIKHGNIENMWPLINLLMAEMWLKSWNL